MGLCADEKAPSTQKPTSFTHFFDRLVCLRRPPYAKWLSLEDNLKNMKNEPNEVEFIPLPQEKIDDDPISDLVRRIGEVIGRWASDWRYDERRECDNNDINGKV